jgi:D-glycero-D-manno-heptose 1,7-bisphosphate phosphatase
MAFDVLKYNKAPTQNADYTPHVPCKPVIGIDRDGIINHIPNNGYVKYPSDLDIIPGALEAIKLIRDKGYRITVITDQPQISKGLLTTYEVDSVHEHLMMLFGQAGIMSIEGLYYNTSDSKEDMYAKPNPGMFKRAENEQPGVDFSKGYYVGDSLVDLKAAIKVKAKPVLIRTGNGEATEQLLNKFSNQELKKKARIYSSLLEFANDLD